MKLAGWLEDFDPTASGSRTSTRQRLARGLGPVNLGYYTGALQRGNTTGKQNGETKKKNEKTKKIEKSNL